MGRQGPSRSVPLPRLFTIAGRNLARHRRRTVLTAASAAASAAALVFFLGFYRGSYDEMFYAAIIDYQTAHAQLQAPGLDPEAPEDWAKPESLLLGWEAPAEAVRRIPGVSGVAPRLELAAFAGNGAEKLPALAAGVDFGRERGVSVFVDRLVAGSLPSARGEALVGDELARLFGLGPGSPLLIQTSTSRGAPNIGRFSVAGIYDSGFPSMDAALVALHLADAQELADAPGAANRVYVRLSSLGRLEGAMPDIARAAAAAGARARPWSDYAADAIEHARTESVFYYVFIVILLVMSAQAVGSTMRASVRERIREIASMRATGWTRRDVFLLFALESAAIGLVGSALGSALGGLCSALLEAFPYDVRAMGQAIDYPFFAITSSSKPGDFALAVAVGAGAAFAAGTAPAVRAARTNIARALSTH